MSATVPDAEQAIVLPTSPGVDHVPPALCGIPLKHISLVTLALQNSLLTLVMHYSRVSTPPSRTYSAATAVLLTELFKATISFAIAFHQKSDDRPHLRLRALAADIFSTDCWKLSIPAILYVIQNNLQYVAVSNLDAATFQVTYQMKILTTAAFSVLLLRKKLSPPQWLALLFLAIGVAIVQIQAAQPSTISSPHSVYTLRNMDTLKGFIAVTAACCTSGLAGVYFEMVLKNSQSDLWVRNVQLSLFSFLPALLPVLIQVRNAEPLSLKSSLAFVFRNFGPWSCATGAVQVLGGLLTALVIKYSDNILKGFATSLSIVISFLASVSLFHFSLTFSFLLGSLIVLAATWLYNQPQKRISKTADTFIMSLARPSSAIPHSGFQPYRSPISPSVYLKRVPSSSSSICSLNSSPGALSEKNAHIR